jgi:hypothetical protein
MVSIHQSIEENYKQNKMLCEWNLFYSKRKEAERIIIEAKGTRDAQNIISEGLTDQI